MSTFQTTIFYKSFNLTNYCNRSLSLFLWIYSHNRYNKQSSAKPSIKSKSSIQDRTRRDLCRFPCPQCQRVFNSSGAAAAAGGGSVLYPSVSCRNGRSSEQLFELVRDSLRQALALHTLARVKRFRGRAKGDIRTIREPLSKVIVARLHNVPFFGRFPPPFFFSSPSLFESHVTQAFRKTRSWIFAEIANARRGATRAVVRWPNGWVSDLTVEVLSSAICFS